MYRGQRRINEWFGMCGTYRYLFSYSYTSDLPSLNQFILDPSMMKSLSSLRFFNIPLLKQIHRTKTEVMSPFRFPALVNFLYYNISNELLQHAQLVPIVDDPHPNESFAGVEYLGHVCHEIQELTPEYIAKMKREFQSGRWIVCCILHICINWSTNTAFHFNAPKSSYWLFPIYFCL